MAMNGSDMGDEMRAAVDAFIAGIPGGATVDREQLFQAMAGAIVAHIVANGVVTLTSPSVTVTSVSGVTTGLGVSGPGTGSLDTSTGTIA